MKTYFDINCATTDVSNIIVDYVIRDKYGNIVLLYLLNENCFVKHYLT